MSTYHSRTGRRAIVAALLLLFAPGLSPAPHARPAGVPPEARFSERSGSFLLTDKLGELHRIRIWSPNGAIRSVTLFREPFKDNDVTSFDSDGNWYARERITWTVTKGKTVRTVTKNLPPREKPAQVPEKAEFDFELKKWQLGAVSAGKPEGPWKLWWPSGEPAGTTHYRLGKRSGETVLLHKNGTVAERRNYADGVLDGLLNAYDATGKRILVQQYRAGRIVNERRFDGKE